MVAIAESYGEEKQVHLELLNRDQTYGKEKSERGHRDELMEEGYEPARPLQARMWKQAHKEGYETVTRGWAALAEELRAKVGGQQEWSDTERHYAFWLVKNERRLAQLMSGKAPEANHIPISQGGKKRVRTYLRRQIRRGRGKRPRVKQTRSFTLDANMYRVFENGKRQYVAVMNLVGKNRVLIPLEGEGMIEGTIRVVLDRERQRIEVHLTQEVTAGVRLTGEVCAVDAGITEVFTDERNQRYGVKLGVVLERGSEHLKTKGQYRNKLHQTAKKATATGNRAKARRIRKYNLGRKKQGRRHRQLKTEIERQINTAINEVIDLRQPCVLVTEKLNLRGKAQSKKMSRKVSLWARNALTHRVEFKASVKGFDRKQVNAAWSSQSCPTCGFVHRQNRQGDRFQCLKCGHAGSSDHVAAINLKNRKDDPEITLWTPKERVKQILLARFNARLEHAERPVAKPDDGTVTVSGRVRRITRLDIPLSKRKNLGGCS